MSAVTPQETETHGKVRIVVVDDSALFRLLIRDVLNTIPDCVVVGTAEDGRAALDAIERHCPDLITLDVEMPHMNGIQTLREMKRRQLAARALVVSRLTESGAQITTDALLEGAFDFILKPAGGGPHENKALLKATLEQKILAFRESQSAKNHVTDANCDSAASPVTESAGRRQTRLIVIGTSTGGPEALRRVLPGLAADLPVPVIVVQHMPTGFTSTLAQRLDESSRISVTEAVNGDELRAGTAAIVPGGRQLKLANQADGRVVIRLTDDPPEHGCQPSVDYVLRSAVDIFDGCILSVIMTGMGRDGTDGCVLARSRGGRVIAQHAHDCVVYGMPKSIIENGLADRVVGLDSLAAVINQEIRSSRR